MSGFPFDAALFRERRLTLGLSQRLLARSVGVSVSTLALVEQGSDHVQHLSLSLSQVRRLADALGVPLSDLLTEPSEQDRSSQDDDPTTRDGALLGELLHSARWRNGAVADARIALGWDRKRFDAAIKALAAALPGTGLRLHRIPGYAALIADGADPAAVEPFKQAESTRVGIRARQAKLIREAVLGKVPRTNLSGFAASSSDRPGKAQGLTSLMRSGLLVQRGKGRLDLSPDLRYCPALEH